MAWGFELQNYPTDTIKVACRKCAREGQYPKSNLVRRYGGSTVLPDVLFAIATCERQGDFSDWCGAYFVELAQR